MQTPDPTLDRIRKTRHEISARFDHDPVKLVAHYMDLDKRFADRLLKEEQESTSDPAHHPKAA